MAKVPRAARTGPPHNPDLRDIVQGKKQWSINPIAQIGPRGFQGWHERGYLPHRDEPGLTQFVTFRLVDSFPEALCHEWEHLFRIEKDEARREALEDYLDKGRGNAWLRSAEVATVVENALLFFHRRRYVLKAWAVMPNHVHVLVEITTFSLSKLIESWKKHSAAQVNKLLGRTGALWQKDYWDTYMRSREHELLSREYIESNPVKAGLVAEARLWNWSSARRRDQYARLQL